MYFAWLGFYTWMLFPASTLGFIIFFYSLVTLGDNVIAYVFWLLYLSTHNLLVFRLNCQWFNTINYKMMSTVKMK